MVWSECPDDRGTGHAVAQQNRHSVISGTGGPAVAILAVRNAVQRQDVTIVGHYFVYFYGVTVALDDFNLLWGQTNGNLVTISGQNSNFD